LPVMEGGLLAFDQRIDEGKVLLARERAIDVVGAGSAGTALVVARLEPGLAEVDGITVHDRGDGIEERQLVLAGETADVVCESGRGERTGGDDDALPLRGRQFDLAALD